MKYLIEYDSLANVFSFTTYVTFCCVKFFKIGDGEFCITYI